MEPCLFIHPRARTCARILPRAHMTPHTWGSSASGCGSIRKCKAQATSWGGSLGREPWL